MSLCIHGSLTFGTHDFARVYTLRPYKAARLADCNRSIFSCVKKSILRVQYTVEVGTIMGGTQACQPFYALAQSTTRTVALGCEGMQLWRLAVWHARPCWHAVGAAPCDLYLSHRADYCHV